MLSRMPLDFLYTEKELMAAWRPDWVAHQDAEGRWSSLVLLGPPSAPTHGFDLVDLCAWVGGDARPAKEERRSWDGRRLSTREDVASLARDWSLGRYWSRHSDMDVEFDWPTAPADGPASPWRLHGRISIDFGGVERVGFCLGEMLAWARA